MPRPLCSAPRLLSFVLLAAAGAVALPAPAAAKPPSSQRAAATAAVRSPEQAAQRLQTAWQRGDRRAAATVATPAAVKKLFGARPQKKLRFEGCDPRDEGGWQCVYADRDLDFSVAFDVDGGASVGAYNVTAVSFSTEAESGGE